MLSASQEDGTTFPLGFLHSCTSSMSSRDGVCINVMLLHLPAARCCSGKHLFVLFFFFLLSKKGCSCTSCILSTQTEAEIAASERGVRKGPRLGYCCHQFSPGPTRVGSISHLFSGAGTLVVSPCPPGGKRGDEEGAPGRRQLLLGLREQLWEQPPPGFSAERLFGWMGLASPVPSWLVAVLTVLSPQLDSMSVLLYGPQLCSLLSSWLNFLNKPAGNDK